LAKNTAAVDPLLGRVLGRRYEIVALIARGGMATVYRAYDRQLDRTVAIKVPRPEFARDRGFSEQFRREARAAARLGHPNIVAVYDSGEERGLPYIVMELVNGQTLRQVLDARGRLTPHATADLLAEVAEALDHAHRAGVAHLDVKPENVLLTEGAVKVADFGLVRAVRDRPQHELAGTVQYLAPEVLRDGPVDGRADIYALGVVAFECLTGKAPFDGPDRREVARRHLEERVPPPSTLLPGIPMAVDQAVGVATEPDPALRYPRAGDFASALGAPRRHWQEALGDPLATTGAMAAAPTVAPGVSRAASHMDTVAAGPLPARPWRPPPRSRRHWPLLALGTVLLVLAGVVGWPYVDPTTVKVPKLTGLTRDQALRALDQAGLRMDEGDEIDSLTVEEGKVARQIPDPGGQIRRSKPIVVQFSAGPPIVRVPDVEGKSEAQAKKQLKSVNLQADLVRQDDATVPRGRVISSDPSPGESAEQGSKVRLVISNGTARVVIPDLRGRPFDEAKQLLEGLGLKVQRELTFSRDLPEGLVIRTDPDDGTEVNRDDQVTVVVASQEFVRVPDVRGEDREDAERELREAGLQPQVPLGAVFNGKVQNQFPRGGQRVPPGTRVFLQLRLRD
jgi:serine/threonine-protein kinase